MPTVIIGSARDIVEHCAVPRFMFVDFPLGNPCGKPWDETMQARVVEQGLGLFESVTEPMTTIISTESWGHDDWRPRFLEVNEQNRAELALKGEDLRRRRANRQPRSK
jgi:hypothetical protein